MFGVRYRNDHTGVGFERNNKKHLEEKGVEVKDFGTQSRSASDSSLDCGGITKSVASGECEAGILICGTGVGYPQPTR